MNTDTLKDALIYSLNFNMANPLMDSIVRVIDASDHPGELMQELSVALVMLRTDAAKIIRSYERNQKALAEYYSESVQQALDEKIREVLDTRKTVCSHVEDPALEWEAV